MISVRRYLFFCIIILLVPLTKQQIPGNLIPSLTDMAKKIISKHVTSTTASTTTASSPTPSTSSTLSTTTASSPTPSTSSTLSTTTVAPPPVSPASQLTPPSGQQPQCGQVKVGDKVYFMKSNIYGSNSKCLDTGYVFCDSPNCDNQVLCMAKNPDVIKEEQI